MAPSQANGSTSPVKAVQVANGNSAGIDTLQLENLLLRDEDIFQTSLNSEDYLESLAPIIKDAIKVNGLAELITKLNDIVKDKDEELNDISLSSTKDINSCIESIDKVHEESADLNRSLLGVSAVLNKSVYELLARKKNLIKTKEVASKINETSVVLNLCVQVLEITNKIHELIKQHRYFSALKLIDELTNVHLPKVENFSFAVKIYDSIPHLTKMIKDESFDNLGKWLSVNLERKIQGIGVVLFDNLFEIQDYWDKIRNDKNQTTFVAHRLNSPIERSMRDPSLNFDIFSDKDMGISLSTIFDAILVYQTLNESKFLAKLYHKEWLKKYNRIIYPITSSSSSMKGTSGLKYNESVAEFANLQALEEYLKKIAAFFVMDNQINLATKFLLRTSANSSDLWDSYVIKLKPVLLQYLRSHKLNLDELTEFKDLVGNFLQILENYDYKIEELYEVLVVIFRDHFGPELIQQFRLDFLDSIQSDHYMPLVVAEKRDYDNVMRICWYTEDADFAPGKVRSMPVSFPFSEDYVHYCLGVRSLLEDILQFITQHYGYELNELNNIIVNELFEKVLGDEKGVGISNDIREFISKNTNNKEIIAQSYTNLEYYLYSLYEIGRLLNRRLRLFNGIGIRNMDAHGTYTLKAYELFSEVRKYSELAIFAMVDQKVAELLDMVEYDDWLPRVRNSEANFSIKDFAMFLENLFTSIFSNLPRQLRTLGLFRSFDVVAQRFLSILQDAGRYNRIAIENFDLDIKHLEESMGSLYSTQDSEEGGGSVALQSTFTELRQCIDLLLTGNYDEFAKNSGYRMREFDRIRLEDGMKLISKIRTSEEDELGANMSGDEGLNTSVHSIDLTQQSIMKGGKLFGRFKLPGDGA